MGQYHCAPLYMTELVASSTSCVMSGEISGRLSGNKK